LCTHVFGLARHDVGEDQTDTIHINLAGPVTSVEAVWAMLAERRTVTFRGNDQRVLFIRHAGLPSGETPYLRIQRRITGLQIDHLILLDRRFAEVEYADTGLAFLFEMPDMHLKLSEHVRQLVNLAVFPAWSERLLEIGHLTRLVRPLASLGEQQVYLVNLDRTRWEHEIALRVDPVLSLASAAAWLDNDYRVRQNLGATA
jgi:hypothetical protein